MGEESGAFREDAGHGDKPRLLDQLREEIRRRYYSRRTEEAYVHWVRRFVWFSGRRHPRELGQAEVTAFLSHLAVERNVAAATQNQALSALLFLYLHVLQVELPWLKDIERARRLPRTPTVLSRAEVERVLGELQGTRWLIASLLYGAGLRLLECLRLRVKDIDFSYLQILVRDGKGAKDRVTMLPERLSAPLRTHLERVRRLHVRDRAEGFGEVELPFALSRKYPGAGKEWIWQYAFPSARRSVDPRSGVMRRHHLDESVPQRAVKEALRACGVASMRAVIRSGIPSPRTFSSPATTSAPCRSCSVTRTSRPP